MDAPDFLRLVSIAQACTADADWTAAADRWARVAAANPVNGDYWARLAEARFETGDHDGARQAYQRVLELGTRPLYRPLPDPDGYGVPPAESVYQIARCDAALGRRADAISGLAAAVSRGLRDLGRPATDPVWAPFLDDEQVRDLLGSADRTTMSRDEGWRADLRLLARELKRRAYAPFAAQTEAEFDASVAGLHDEIPGLTDAQVTVGFMKLVRHLDDGHAYVLPSQDRQALFPLDTFLFPEGLHVIAAGPGYQHLLGAKVEAIGGRPVAEAIAALDPVMPRDNDQQVTLELPVYLRHGLVLHGLGLTPEPGTATFTVRSGEGDGGGARDVTVSAVPGRHDWHRYPPGWTALPDTITGRPRPLHLRNRELPYWFEYLPADDVVYFQFNAVRDHPAETFAAFGERLFLFVSEHRSARLVIDLRWNGGGNTLLSQALLHHLVACRRLTRRGALYVIIGRLTFSAAQNTATAIERETNAIFVGEPTGSRPNFIGEAIPFTLPYSGLRANAGDFYWQTSWPNDHRTWIAPDIYAPPTFAAYSRNEDPAMEAILSVSGQFPA